MSKTNLTVTVVHIAGRKANAAGRKAPATIGVVSFVTSAVNPTKIVLASTKQPLAGRYSEGQLLARLRSHPADFQLTPVGQDALPALLG